MRFAILKDIVSDKERWVNALVDEIMQVPVKPIRERMMKILGISIPKYTKVVELKEEVVYKLLLTLIKSNLNDYIIWDKVEHAYKKAWLELGDLLKKEIVKHPEKI